MFKINTLISLKFYQVINSRFPVFERLDCNVYKKLENRRISPPVRFEEMIALQF